MTPATMEFITRFIDLVIVAIIALTLLPVAIGYIKHRRDAAAANV